MQHLLQTVVYHHALSVLSGSLKMVTTSSRQMKRRSQTCILYSIFVDAGVSRIATVEVATTASESSYGRSSQCVSKGCRSRSGTCFALAIIRCLIAYYAWWFKYQVGSCSTRSLCFGVSEHLVHVRPHGCMIHVEQKAQCQSIHHNMFGIW